MIGIKELVLILANAIHHEARSEDYKTKLLVASVIMERVIQDKKSLKDVIYKPKAFSNFRLYMPKEPKDIKSFNESRQIAEGVIKRQIVTHRGYKYFNDKNLGVLHKTKIKPIYTSKLIFY